MMMKKEVWKKMIHFNEKMYPRIIRQREQSHHEKLPFGLFVIEMIVIVCGIQMETFHFAF